MSEDEAVALARSGDESAFSFLYAVHHPKVLKYCRHKLRSPEDAEDVTQDIFLLVHRNLGKYLGNSSFSTWLHRITNNAVVSHLRHKRIDIVDCEDVPEMVQPPTQHLMIEIKESLNNLSDLQRFCVEANVMGYSMKGLGGKDYLNKARKRLKAR